MKTVTFQTVLNRAAEYAMRTFDQIPGQEYHSLQDFLSEEFRTCWNRISWPELIPPIANIQAANSQFSKNQGQANEIGDIIGIYPFNPQACTWHHRRVPYISWSEGDNVVYVETHHTSLWVEYKLPYPGTTWPDLSPEAMNTAAFLAALCPDFFQKYLALKAAGQLLNSDNPGSGNGRLAEAESALADEINRPARSRPPWWRSQLMLGRSRRHMRY